MNEGIKRTGESKTTKQAGENTQHATPGRQRAGYKNPNMKLRRPMSRSSAGEEVTKHAEVFRDILKRESETDFNVLVLDGQTHLLPASAVLLTLSEKKAGQTYVAFYVLLVESSTGGRLANRTVNINQQPVEVITVTGDVYDDIYFNKVEALLRTTYGDDCIITESGCMTIPSESTPEDKHRMREIMFQSSTALCTTIVEACKLDEEKFNVGWFDKEQFLSARLEFGTGMSEDATGLPVRNDINIVLQSAIRQDTPSSQYDQIQDITRVGGFIDLVYNPASAPQQQTMGFQPPQAYGQPQMPTPQYMPRFVMDACHSEVNAVTMEIQLLAMSTSVLLSRDYAWTGAFQPNYAATKGRDLRDIGAVGYEVNLTGDPAAKDFLPVDTKAEGFDQTQLFGLLQATVAPELIYSMDIEETGSQSWIHGAFSAAAEGNADAIAVIVDAADNLTHGQFSKLFDGKSQMIASDDKNRIHLGYYTAEDGTARDLRDLDYLAVLNLVGGRDMQTVIDFADTFDRTEISPYIRLERRARIIQALLGDSVKFKGYANRFTFSPDFIVALTEACRLAGLVVRPSNIAQDFTQMGVRGNANIGSMAVRNLGTGFYQHQAPQYGKHQAMYGAGNRFTRFGS